jgi:hypothetical protein
MLLLARSQKSSTDSVLHSIPPVSSVSPLKHDAGIASGDDASGALGRVVPASSPASSGSLADASVGSRDSRLLS